MNILHIEVNDSGGWRRVMSFDGHRDVMHAVMEYAAALLENSQHQRIRARIIAPSDTAPVMTWTAADGWKEWRS